MFKGVAGVPFTRETLGAHRVLEPPGALPQAAVKLDVETPPLPFEMAVDVEVLSLDSTSHRQIREDCNSDPDAMAGRIRDIVSAAGKMHNPVTDSGGILLGTVSYLGSEFRKSAKVAIGDRIATEGSLTMTPLSLTAVGPVDPASPHIPATGRAIIAATAGWTHAPDDMPFRLMVSCLDVYGAAPHVRDLAEPDQNVVVIGAGRAGLLALAAARRAVGAAGVLTAVDASPAAVALAESAGLCDHAVTADATDALGVLAALQDAGVEPADLTVSVVNVPRCEVAAVLATRPGGTVLFFSMSTSFTRATLGAESFCAQVTMLLGSGFYPDRGAYTLELVRGNRALWDALCENERVAS